MGDKSCARGVLALGRNLLLAIFLYGSIYTLVRVYQGASAGSLLRQSKSQSLDKSNSHETGDGSQGSSHGPSAGLPSSKIHLDKVNPHANWFNRPESLVVAKDDFLGKRPDIDTVANLTMLVEACRGSYAKIEKMPYVYDCLKYMETEENRFYSLPSLPERASQQSPKQAEYVNADGASNSLQRYPSYKSASKSSLGQCAGPIIPYHVYWTGPATWRVEAFVKSYLHTQNLPCSRLWIWLDADRNANAVEDMLHRDPLFVKFFPFLERGDIQLRAWNFPSRIPLPAGDNTDGVGYYKNPGRPNAAGERVVADNLVRDESGQEWLALTDKQKTFLPVAVSDAVRFVVLHLHGGAYFDMDVLMLRDLRPLLLDIDHGHAFAERWAAHADPGDYNTAVMSLTANSSLSSYLLRGGVRMGANFHPRVVGRMAVKDGRDGEFAMLETAAFDPIWTEFNNGRQGQCTVPCFKDYGQVFKGDASAFPQHDEWEAFEGRKLENVIDDGSAVVEETNAKGLLSRGYGLGRRSAVIDVKSQGLSLGVQAFDVEALRKAEYRIEEDKYPPNNRTMENFFRGAWTYHIHNQVSLANTAPSTLCPAGQRLMVPRAISIDSCSRC